MNLDYLIVFGGLALFFLLFRQTRDIVFAIVIIGGAYLLYGSPSTAGIIGNVDHSFVAFVVFAVIALVWFVSDARMLGQAARQAPTAEGKARAVGASVGNGLVFAVVVLVIYAGGKVHGWW